MRESKQGKEEDDVKKDKSRSPGRDSKQGKEEDDVKKDRERRHRKEGEDVKKDKVQAPDRYRKQGKEEDDVKKDESRSVAMWHGLLLGVFWGLLWIKPGWRPWSLAGLARFSSWFQLGPVSIS